MNLIKKYFPKITVIQSEKFFLMEKIYKYWNHRINLVSKNSMHNFYERHILHSLAILKIINFSDNTYIMDLGTGGGFPGIPIAIFCPKINFLLVDSINKKIKIVNILINELNLNNITTCCERAEKIEKKFDFVLSRSVASIPKLFSWVEKKIILKSNNRLNNGILCFKGGNIKKELYYFNNYKEFFLNNYFSELFFKEKKIIHIPIISNNIS